MVANQIMNFRKVFEALVSFFEKNNIDCALIVALKVFAIKNDPQRFHSEMADIKALMDMKIVNEDTVKRYFKKWNLVDVLDVNGVKKNGY